MPASDADLAQNGDEHRGEAEDEDELSDGARVPSDDGDGRAVPLARIPAGQRGERQQQPEEEGEPSAHPGEICGEGQARRPLGRSIACSI